jgi:hypothetical protein
MTPLTPGSRTPAINATGVAIMVAFGATGCLNLKVATRYDDYTSADYVMLSAELTNRSRVPFRVCQYPYLAVDRIVIDGRRVNIGAWVLLRNQDLAPQSYRWLKRHETIRWGALGLTGAVRGEEVFYYRLERAGTYSVRFVYRCTGAAPLFSNWLSVKIDPTKPPPAF